MRRLTMTAALALLVGCTNETPTPRDGSQVKDGPDLDRKTMGDLRRADGPLTADDAIHDVAVGDTGPAPDTGNPFPPVSGKATYYDADGSGNCSFPASPQDLMVAALNTPDYNGAQSCGGCVLVQGPSGSVTVRIVDRCPGCSQGHIDLSKQAFAKIADLTLGVVPVTWAFVPCTVQGPIRYHFKSGSNQWWSAIQVRNHRYPVKTLEAQVGGSFVTVNRELYNYFVYSSGLGPGPYTLRVTDVLGHVLTDTNIPFKENQEVPGAAQFPP